MDSISINEFKRVRDDVDAHSQLLDGEPNRLGLAAMVLIMWRTYIWLLCGLSAAGGSLITYLVMRS